LRTSMQKIWQQVRDVRPATRIVGAVLFVAGLVAIFGYVGWNPLASTPPSPAIVLNRILANSDKLNRAGDKASRLKKIAPIAAHLENTCVAANENAPPHSAMRCWLLLSSFYIGSEQYRKAISAIGRAQDLDTRIADPYYTLAVLYHELIFFDLIEKKRYEIVSDQHLIVNVRPDSTSDIFAHLASEQLQQGQGLAIIGEHVPRGEPVVTSQQEIAQTKEQIDAIENGASVLAVNVNNILAFATLIDDIYPNNNTVPHFSTNLVEILNRYIKSHPDQFPGIPTNIFSR
jgi:hypothetical protein